MRCFFLGTGAADGIPALFCECEVCEEARRRGGADRRTRSTVLIDGTIKIDLPPDTLAHVHTYPQLRLGRMEHLLFTHSHDDHFAIRELQYLASCFAPRRGGASVGEKEFPLSVWGTEELLARVHPELMGCFQRPALKLCALEPFVETRIGHLLVTPIVAHHKNDELCFNYLLRDRESSATLLYGTDTGWWDEPTWEFLERRRIDTVILECGKGAVSGGYDGHLDVDQCVTIRERLVSAGGLLSSAPVYLTHISHTGLLLHKELTERVAPHGIRVAYDGLEITL